MAKRTKKSKQRVIGNNGLAVSWNTASRVVWITLRGGVSMGFTWQDAMHIADQLLLGAEAVETASEEDEDGDDFDAELDQRLRDQLNSEVSAAMDAGCRVAPCPSPPAPLPGVPGRGEPEATTRTGPAAVPSSSDHLGGTARLAEELGSARETLAEILASSLQETPQEGYRQPAQITQLAGWPPRPRPHYETLMVGLAEHPTDPGKILIGGHAISLGHARNYGIAISNLISKQASRAFGAKLCATVETPEPPAEVPTLRAD